MANKNKSPYSRLLDYLFGQKYYILVFRMKAANFSEVCGICFPDRYTAEQYATYFMLDTVSYSGVKIHSFRSRQEIKSTHLYDDGFKRFLQANKQPIQGDVEDKTAKEGK